MNTQYSVTEPTAIPVSPLLLADRLLTLAQDADRAGLPSPAAQLLKLAFALWSEKPARRTLLQ